jgi:hypothetical protein
MDKLEQYREYVQQLMTRYASGDKAQDGVEVELVMDTVRDHYQWMNVGWVELKRIYDCYIHIMGWLDGAPTPRQTFSALV